MNRAARSATSNNGPGQRNRGTAARTTTTERREIQIRTAQRLAEKEAVGAAMAGAMGDISLVSGRLNRSKLAERRG